MLPGGLTNTTYAWQARVKCWHSRVNRTEYASNARVPKLTVKPGSSAGHLSTVLVCTQLFSTGTTSKSVWSQINCETLPLSRLKSCDLSTQFKTSTNTRNRHKACENACEQITIGFGLDSHCLRNGANFANQSLIVVKQTRNNFRKKK